MKSVIKFWILGVAGVFGVMIVGFLAWTTWKAFVQPRAAAAVACATESSCLYTVVNGSNNVRVMGFSPDGERLLTDGANIVLHDGQTGEQVSRLNPDFDASFRPVFMGERREVAAVGREEIAFYDYEGALLRSWRADPGEPLTEFVSLPLVDGFALALEETIAIYRMSDGSQFTQFPDSAGMSQLTASADGAWLAAYHDDTQAVHVWPLAQLDAAFSIREAGAVSRLQMSGDGSLLAWHTEQGAYVWRTTDAALLGRVEGPEVQVTALSLAANGQRLAVGYDDSFVEIWSLHDEAIVDLFEHQSPLSEIALSPDGERLAVGLRDSTSVTIITEEERRARQRRAERSGRGDHVGVGTFVETQPGFAIVWDVNP